jgi:hypothetical protein
MAIGTLFNGPWRPFLTDRAEAKKLSLRPYLISDIFQNSQQEIRYHTPLMNLIHDNMRHP